MDKIVLAYSGGLDTSVIIPWLKENYNNAEIIAVCADVGQGQEIDTVYNRAIKSGASKCYICDLKEDFVKYYVFDWIKSGSKYEGKYLLGTSLARPIISKALVDIAKKEGAYAICHGATGKGNDQVRFELGIKALAPDLKIIAPWRIWNIKSRDDAVAYGKLHNIEMPVQVNKSPYSRDRNVLHLSHEGYDLEYPEKEHSKDLYQICTSVYDAPNEPECVEIDFEEGAPIAINNKKLNPLELLDTANKIAAKHGVGILDIVENRLVGMKSRGVYETPGGTLLLEAHTLLESITLDRDTTLYKEQIGIKYSQLVYDGLWFTPLREALSAFIGSTQKYVTGKVKIKLYKGGVYPVSITSKYSLYNEEIATFGEDNIYNQKDAEGFINLFGLPLKVNAMMKQKNDLL